MRRIERGELASPAIVLDIDRERKTVNGCRTLAVDEYRSAFSLLRSEGVPVAVSCWDVDGDAIIDAEWILRQEAEFVADYSLGLRPNPSELTVAICTRERPDDLRRALSSLLVQSDQNFSVVIVDNAPTSSATRAVVEELELPRWKYVVEPEPGLSRARNRALNFVQTEHVAWIDDDEVADVDWVLRVKQGFNHESQPAALAGLMLPAELESEAQVRFEQYGGFNKGRGVEPEVLRAGTPSVFSPLYPLPGFGAGGNMAFRVDALSEIGGFDPYLGAGSRTKGGEDTRALALLLLRGDTVLHWPPAVTWHYHRRGMDELERQLFGNLAGLSAFYASMIRSNPRVVVEIAKAVPHGVWDMLPQKDNLRSGHLPADFPKELLDAARRGFAAGGVLYVQEVWAGRPAKAR